MEIKDLGNIFGRAPKVIRRAGDLKHVTVDGKEFEKQEVIYVPNMGVLKCIDYGNHFIFRDVRRIGATLFCTCSSPASAFGYEVYRYGASKNQGTMLGCMYHAGAVTGVPGRHADGSQ